MKTTISNGGGWAAFKRLLYRLVPALAYIDRLEDENAALKSQLQEMTAYVLKMTERAYFPDLANRQLEAKEIEPDDLRSYSERRSHETLERYVKTLGFADLKEYEASLHAPDAPPASAANVQGTS